MALKFSKDIATSAACDKSNIYSSDPAAGMELVSKIISSYNPHARSKEYSRINYLIDNKLLSFSEKLELKNELELYSRLVAISDRLMYPQKYKMLKNRTVIGLGGKFSAGKSLFINSVLGWNFKIQLPVAQDPSTSVPTYIISGSEDEVYAYTSKGAQVMLDSQAVSAISHDFQNKYGLGLGQYISFISISAVGFRENIALLDTPGYNKADSTVIESFSDTQKAFSQLKTIDYLIWLVDIQNGTLTEDDIKFISSLNMRTKLLIVINKCDLKTPEECESITGQVRSAVQKAGIDIYNIVPYSSMYPEQNNGREMIEEFFEYAQKCETRVDDIKAQIHEIAVQLDNAFSLRIEELERQRNEIGNIIFGSNSFFDLKAMISMYGSVNSDLSLVRRNYRGFKETEEEIYKALRRL